MGKVGAVGDVDTEGRVEELEHGSAPK
jgi:hypothetical protein